MQPSQALLLLCHLDNDQVIIIYPAVQRVHRLQRSTWPGDTPVSSVALWPVIHAAMQS